MNILKIAIFGLLSIVVASVALAFAPLPLPNANVLAKPTFCEPLIVSERQQLVATGELF
jgi:hypothetical protein